MTSYRLNGRSVTRDEFLKNARGITPGVKQEIGDRFRKIEANSISVHPDQIEEAVARNKKHGLTGIEYRPDGDAVCTSRKALERAAAFEGYRVGKKELEHGRRR